MRCAFCDIELTNRYIRVRVQASWHTSISQHLFCDYQCHYLWAKDKYLIDIDYNRALPN